MNRSTHVTKLELFEETALFSEMDSAIKSLLCRAFPSDAAVFATSRHWHGSVPTYSLIHRAADETLAGHVGVVVRVIHAGTQPVQIAGIQNLAVAPEWRGHGIGQQLMTGAMDEAQRRGVPFGLLFCVPTLEQFYARLGWNILEVTARMDFGGQHDVPIPGKNITMIRNLADQIFPHGHLSLQGPDW